MNDRMEFEIERTIENLRSSMPTTSCLRHRELSREQDTILK